MTAFDRIERSLPELIDELAATAIPDYFDDMLRSTTQVRQRPAWSSLERWLPMGVITLSTPTRRVPWQYLALVVAVLLIAAAALAYVGASWHAVPPPFGPARNGVIAYGTADGDIASWDPVSGTRTTIIGGTGHETYPGFSLDGTRLIFARTGADPSTESDFVAAADGSNVRPLISGSNTKWYDESGSGDRALISRIVGASVVQSMLDIATGHETPLDVDPSLGITIGMFRPGHDQVIYAHVPDDGGRGMAVYLARGDGTGPLEKLGLAPDAINDPWPSPDGSKLVYSTWGEGADGHGRTHVFDIDTRTDTTVLFDGSPGTVELFPQFSPDGARIALVRWGDAGYQVVIGPADGKGPEVPVGPVQPIDSGNAQLLWSPDGSQLLVSYEVDKSTWMLPADGSPGKKLDGMSWDRGVTWQRLAQ